MAMGVSAVREQVRKQALTMEYAITAIQQIALGIFYLHQCKLPVLHLDLKSANVLLDEHGIAKVCTPSALRAASRAPQPGPRPGPTPNRSATSG